MIGSFDYLFSIVIEALLGNTYLVIAFEALLLNNMVIPYPRLNNKSKTIINQIIQ
jgi:hypothetical protein